MVSVPMRSRTESAPSGQTRCTLAASKPSPSMNAWSAPAACSARVLSRRRVVAAVSIPQPARLAPDHPAVFLVSGLAREILLALTGERGDGRAAGGYDRAALERLRRVLVDELREAREQPLHLPQPRDDRVRAVALMLREDPADNTSLAELLAAAGASARTLSRLFRTELGITFYEWRTQLRIYHALVLLADGHDTSYVAHACGWANPSSFIAAFAGIIGTTPGRYRTGDVPG
ncbi:AraC family transcriptional regulator [Trebonia kvetii]|uniref:HTH-type transcriptional regulator RipA n=1 Tax=Trebonia kvetii TaxID=2480626 RepID=A0A6P2C1N7_9ACTN|nr:AraC family transcriptional regulator [Trebonia kvetii]